MNTFVRAQQQRTNKIYFVCINYVDDWGNEYINKYIWLTPYEYSVQASKSHTRVCTVQWQMPQSLRKIGASGVWGDIPLEKYSVYKWVAE